MIPDKIHRHRVVTLAGCYRNWIAPASPQVGDSSHYINWIAAESLMDAHQISPEQADAAWETFRDRHKSAFPYGEWQDEERAYEQSLLTEQK